MFADACIRCCSRGCHLHGLVFRNISYKIGSHFTSCGISVFHHPSLSFSFSPGTGLRKCRTELPKYVVHSCRNFRSKFSNRLMWRNYAAQYEREVTDPIVKIGQCYSWFLFLGLETTIAAFLLVQSTIMRSGLTKPRHVSPGLCVLIIDNIR